MKIAVTGCDDCSFLDGEYEICMMPGIPSTAVDWHSLAEHDSHYITPDWCPLREEPVTVELVKKEQER